MNLCQVFCDYQLTNFNEKSATCITSPEPSSIETNKQTNHRGDETFQHTYTKTQPNHFPRKYIFKNVKHFKGMRNNKADINLTEME